LEVWDCPGSRFGDEDHFELKDYFVDNTTIINWK